VAFNIGSPLALRGGLTWAGHSTFIPRSFHVASAFVPTALHLRKPGVEWTWNRGALPRPFHLGSSHAIFSGHSSSFHEFSFIRSLHLFESIQPRLWDSCLLLIWDRLTFYNQKFSGFHEFSRITTLLRPLPRPNTSSPFCFPPAASAAKMARSRYAWSNSGPHCATAANSGLGDGII
jgi:hypothetical protein